MEVKYFVAITGIVCVAALGGIALLKGINSTLLSSCFTIIGGIVGGVLGFEIGLKRVK
jgi:hypothetical protein